MSDTDYSGEYWRLSGLVDEVVEAACYAVLRVAGYYQDDQGGMTTTGAGDYSIPRPGSGQYPDDPLPNFAGPDGFPAEVPSVGDIYRMLENDIPPIFAPFHDLPSPGLFESLADDVRVALKMLSSSGNLGSGDDSGSGDSAPGNIDYEGNSTLALADQVAQTLNGWEGGAATSFATYLNLFEGVVGNQALAAEVLRITLYMESEMMRRLQSDVVDLAHKAINAFEGCGGITVGDVKAAMSVVGTVNTVLGWFPAFKPVTGPVGTALSVTGVVVNSLGGGDATPNPLGARAYYDVISKMQDAADQLCINSAKVEQDISDTLSNLHDHISAAPAARSGGGTDQESFKLDRPSGTYDAVGTADFIYPGVVINPDNISTAADTLEQDLAAEMTQAANGLGDADSSNAWRRDSRIGIGPFGAWSQYTAASQLLENEVRETANEMGWAASMLRAVWEDVSGTDDNIAQDFDGVRGKIHTYDHPAPTPVPPGHQQVPYF